MNQQPEFIIRIGSGNFLQFSVPAVELPPGTLNEPQ